MNEIAIPAPSKTELQLGASVQEMCAAAIKCVVTSDAHAEQATSLLSSIKAASNRAEAERRALVDPLNGVVKALNERFKKTFLNRLDDAERAVKAKIGGYLADKRRAAEEEARKAREREAQMAEEGRSRAAQNAAVKAAVAEQVAAETTSVRGSAGGGVSIQKRWTFELLEMREVPREWLELNETAVRRAIAQGVREIAGLRIYQQDVVASR